jgi:PAS domain S-box-containing protein
MKERDDYQALLSIVSAYVAAVNRDFQIIMSNERFQAEFGVHPDGICYQVWRGRSSKCKNCVVEKSFQDGEIHTSEETVVFRDGRKRKAEVRATPIKNDCGEIIFVLETVTDISEKKRLQAKVRRMGGAVEERLADQLLRLQGSEEKFRTIFERCQDLILIFDADGRIEDVNPSAVRILGYGDTEELLALGSVAELFDDPKAFIRVRRQLWDRGVVKNLKISLRTKQGQALDALLWGNLITDAQGKVIVEAMIRDVASGKRMRDEMRQSSEQLAALNRISLTVSSSIHLDEVLSNTIDAILTVFQADSVRIYLLDEAAGYLHLAASRGLSQRFLEKPYVQRRALGAGLLGEAVQQGKAVILENWTETSKPFVDAVLEEGLKSVAYIPLLCKGRTLGALGISSRSTQKFSGQQVEFLTSVGSQIGMAVEHANLYEKTCKALEQLKSAQEHLLRTEKLASLGKLAATIAHEINNPLASVLTYVKLMLKLIRRDRFGPERLGEITRYLTTMEAETSRCGDIVKNLLAFARRSETDMKPNSVREILERTLAIISHDLGLRGVQVTKKLDDDLPTIHCDFKQIQQAFLNVIINAAEAMPEGGPVVLEAHRAPEDGFVEISITDAGCGIPPDHAKLIFEPFFTTKEEGKGVGLGLPVVYGIVTRHNGTIEVESPPAGEEHGARFRIRLPVAAEATETRAKTVEVSG